MKGHPETGAAEFDLQLATAVQTLKRPCGAAARRRTAMTDMNLKSMPPELGRCCRRFRTWFW